MNSSEDSSDKYLLVCTFGVGSRESDWIGYVLY